MSAQALTRGISAHVREHPYGDIYQVICVKLKYLYEYIIFIHIRQNCGEYSCFINIDFIISPKGWVQGWRMNVLCKFVANNNFKT